ncbi:hypothetical protein NIASO_04565 [Niabella soli DSM 19437]|uniref:Uncharacterized protein n=1 Tax=Niabella soli DSM 19437 TaxID=929713 RepID=W0F730_9BACT|nr:hypothetical protein NIASO_04565 [Niabella soli DSM 19437]
MYACLKNNGSSSIIALLGFGLQDCSLTSAHRPPPISRFWREDIRLSGAARQRWNYYQQVLKLQNLLKNIFGREV